MAGEKPEANPNDEPRGEAKGPGTEAFTPSQGEETSTRDPLLPRLTEGSHRAKPLPNYRRILELHIYRKVAGWAQPPRMPSRSLPTASPSEAERERSGSASALS